MSQACHCSATEHRVVQRYRTKNVDGRPANVHVRIGCLNCGHVWTSPSWVGEPPLAELGDQARIAVAARSARR